MKFYFKHWFFNLNTLFAVAVIVFFGVRAFGASSEKFNFEELFDSIQESLELTSTDTNAMFNLSKTNVVLVKVAQVDSVSHTELKRVDSKGGMRIELRYDSEVQKNPLLMLKDLSVAQLLLGRNLEESTIAKHYPMGRMAYYWSELAENIEAGSLGAEMRLYEIEAAALKDSRSLAAITLAKHFGDAAVNAASAAMLEQLAAQNALKSEKLERQQAAKQAEWENWKKGSGSWESNEKLELKLDDLVVRNDRTGVAKLIREYLPWILMEPTEVTAWQNWLEAIERPNARKTMIVYRGIDYRTDKMQSWIDSNGKKHLGFLSTVLTKNQGSYTRRLRSLQTSRAKNADNAFTMEASPNFHGSVVDTFYRHAMQPEASTYLSFTSDIAITKSFIGRSANDVHQKTGGLLAVRVDSRRMFANRFGFIPEAEYLVPLIIFPDEILSYVEVSAIESLQFEKTVQRVKAEVERKTGIKGDPPGYDAHLRTERFVRDQEQSMKLLTKPFSKAINCQGLF